ncbi:MAG TPA: hypothetical protein GXX37_11265 [Clostridiaceae bacterium]|nr:hypothetical protein [Clostridiaceae bacterium]
MMEIIIENWENILFILIFVIIIGVLFYTGNIKKIKQILFYLVIKAEKELGSGTGELKYAAVTTWLYERLPTIGKILFSTKQIDALIEEAVAKMKQYLSENENARRLINSIDK